ncbi:MAG: ferredoxin [Candidatus Omnitrophica bacterium]|nr:ferredoxin [Candidatus Omnitrophota bacterium]
MIRKSNEAEMQALEQVANLMCAAARTAPKTRGIDNIQVLIATDNDIKKLIPKMIEIAARENRKSCDRDAHNIENARACVIIGAKANPAGLNCGFCGFKTCEELKKAGAICAYNSMDLGIAVSSAVSIAAQFHIDNRIMYSIGLASLELGLFEKDIKQVVGIPLSATGKNIFFDRKI